MLSDEKIISMYNAGFSLQYIFEKYGIEVAYIRRLLASNDIHIRENDK
jgi:hypothetical protein